MTTPTGNAEKLVFVKQLSRVGLLSTTKPTPGPVVYRKPAIPVTPKAGIASPEKNIASIMFTSLVSRIFF
jgi:hypothetical protein